MGGYQTPTKEIETMSKRTPRTPSQRIEGALRTIARSLLELGVKPAGDKDVASELGKDLVPIIKVERAEVKLRAKQAELRLQFPVSRTQGLSIVAHGVADSLIDVYSANWTAGKYETDIVEGFDHSDCPEQCSFSPLHAA